MGGLKLPEATVHQLLPPGIHECSLDEVKERFGRFQRTDQRPRLFRKLSEYIDEIKTAGWSASIIINGSFVMEGVNEPADIDLILVLPKDWNMASDVKPFEYNLLSRRRVRKVYGFDVFPVREGSAEQEEWIGFFMKIGPKWNDELDLPVGLEKGIVRIIS